MSIPKRPQLPPPALPLLLAMDGLNQVQFRIVEDEHNGRHLVAIRNLSAGELIFSETPTACSPGDTDGVCIVCCTDIDQQDVCNKCWWPVCSQHCINSTSHQAECRVLASCLSKGPECSLPTRHLLYLRCLLLRSTNPRLWQSLLQLYNHHGIQTFRPDSRRLSNDKEQQQQFKQDQEDQNIDELTQFIIEDCGLSIPEEEIEKVFLIINSSTFNMSMNGNEFPSLYLTGALLTQSCIQNTRCVYKGHDNRIHIYAAVDIKKGDKITHSYLRNLVHTGTLERRKMLREQLIDCFCPRCSDPTELETNVSSIFCQKCQGLCLPLNPLDDDSDWKCRKCDNQVSKDFVNTLILSLQEEQPAPFSHFLLKNEQIIPKTHYLMTSQRTKIFLKTSHKVKESLEKIEAGKELLKLTDILEPGLSAHRESILVNLGISLQILLSHELVRRINLVESEGLSDSQVYAAFRDAVFCFKEALLASKLELDQAIPEKIPTLIIEENLTTLDLMKEEFENIMTQSNQKGQST